MIPCTNSSPRPISFAYIVLLAAAFALPAFAQTRPDDAAFQKISFKPTKTCAVPAEGEVTSLVKNGVELSVTEDFDCDGVPDAYDNCVGIPNQDQADSDHNGIGDACEAATTVRAELPSKNRPKTKSIELAESRSAAKTKETAKHRSKAKSKDRAKDKSNSKRKDRKAIAADRHSRASERKRRRR